MPLSCKNRDKHHIAIVWQRFLPYHNARIRHLNARLAEEGHSLTAIEVAGRDASYGFVEESSDRMERLCCFPGLSYHDLSARAVHAEVLSALEKTRPDVVLAPATPFPEGMAAISYRLRSNSVGIMMDDAWEHTDRKGLLTRQVKRLIHSNLDGALIPAPSHLSYYVNLGLPRERIFFGVDVVNNEYFEEMSARARLDAPNIRVSRKLPRDYFLYVGRFLPRKGLETLAAAYRNYRSKTGGKPWSLVMVGAGSHMKHIKEELGGTPGVIFAGARFGDDLCRYYALANVLVVPSLSDPWGLVVNEGLASGLPVIVSRGCGASRTLVHEGENGWTFEPDNVDSLTELMLRASALPGDVLLKMSKSSQEIIAAWSLDRFADGVLEAMEIPRRPPAGFMANIAARVWKGRVRIT